MGQCVCVGVRPLWVTSNTAGVCVFGLTQFLLGQRLLPLEYRSGVCAWVLGFQYNWAYITSRLCSTMFSLAINVHTMSLWWASENEDQCYRKRCGAPTPKITRQSSLKGTKPWRSARRQERDKNSDIRQADRYGIAKQIGIKILYGTRKTLLTLNGLLQKSIIRSLYCCRELLQYRNTPTTNLSPNHRTLTCKTYKIVFLCIIWSRDSGIYKNANNLIQSEQVENIKLID